MSTKCIPEMVLHCQFPFCHLQTLIDQSVQEKMHSFLFDMFFFNRQSADNLQIEEKKRKIIFFKLSNSARKSIKDILGLVRIP